MIPESIKQRISECPHEPLFVTVSGAHLYGFESLDSDWDLRGAFIAPLSRVLSLTPASDTYEVVDKACAPEVDFVLHETAKYFRMLLKSNGYVLEQVFSPIVAHASAEFEEFRDIARRCVSRQHRHHFFHFGVDQWTAVSASRTPTVKGLLYTYRPLLVGIHLMRTGQIESNLRRLNEQFHVAPIDDLIARKTAGAETMAVSPAELETHRPWFDRLCATLEEARATSALPEGPPAPDELDAFLFRLRLSRASRAIPLSAPGRL